MFRTRFYTQKKCLDLIMTFRIKLCKMQLQTLKSNDPLVNPRVASQLKTNITQHPPPHGPNCQSEGPRPIPVDFGCSRFIFERLVGFKKFGWAVFEKNDFLKIWLWVWVCSNGPIGSGF